MPLIQRLSRTARVLSFLLILCLAPLSARADDGLSYETETLANGLQVIYASIPTSPVTHVRVLYHVGSKDERPDRQGFAHMFEHMMFRGSAHVSPQEHMKLIGLVGGYSNAYTSFDKTVYINTVPNTYTNMALWLEADRMSSFKVSPEIFYTERLVVAEEWRIQQNQPYGTVYDKLLATMFTTHSYRWTPIGNMDHLRAAAAGELQAFFNKYYVPNNAILVVAGNIDIAQTKKEVHQYYGWIPKGELITRNSPKEPEQTEARRVEMTMRVPLPRLMIGYPMPPIASDDQDALGVMLTILGEGQSSRLSRSLVTNADPLCVQASSMGMDLEDGGVMGVLATILDGKDPAAVESVIREQVAAICDKPVTTEELEKAKQQGRLALAQRWETADKAGADLGDTLQMYGSLNRVKTERARLEAITTADVQRVAKKYLVATKSTTLLIKPGTPKDTDSATTQSTQPATEPVMKEVAKELKFPDDYPTQAPMAGELPAATFEKGVEKTMNGVRVVVMEDHRIPVVHWGLTFRQGGHAEPAGKEGLAGMTAQMVRRGPTGMSFDQFNEQLESRGIKLNVSDGGDYTRVGGSCLKEELPVALNAMRNILLTPAFDAEEFKRLKEQSTNSLQLALNNPRTVGSRSLTQALYGDSPLGRLTTIQSLNSITLDDVKQFYDTIYRSTDAILMISGDISVTEGQQAAERLLAGMKGGALPKAEYNFTAAPAKIHIILVDRPESKQSSIRMGIRAYDISSNEKFAGSLATQILSSGIDSRLGRYVRAEKGYAYGVEGYFQPGRQGGAFAGDTDTKFETTASAIEAMFKVFDEMKSATVSEKELADAKFRVAGQLLMSMQTMEQQASRRIDGVLNGYPIDYYDKYAERIGQVTAEDIKAVMNKYVLEDHLTVVVVAPATAVKAQLERLGTVEVVPMPLVH